MDARPQSSIQGENRLCSQCWDERVWIWAGYGQEVLLWPSLSLLTPSEKQRTVPCFSCLLNGIEMTRKRKDAWKLENPKIRQEKVPRLNRSVMMKTQELGSFWVWEGNKTSLMRSQGELQHAGLFECTYDSIPEQNYTSEFLGTSHVRENMGDPVVSFHDPFFQWFCAIYPCSPL